VSKNTNDQLKLEALVDLQVHKITIASTHALGTQCSVLVVKLKGTQNVTHEYGEFVM
jgi:hypothetical protein